MTRVLFCVIPEQGHLNPYIGPAQVLQESGVEVLFHASADISAQLRRAGLERFVGPPGALAADVNRGAAFAACVRDAAWLRRWIGGLLVDGVAAAVAPLRALLRELRPDVVALDPMLYAAAIACELERVPWAALSNSLNPLITGELDSELLRTVQALASARQALFARYGLAPRFAGCDILSPHLTVAFATEALAGARAGVALVGPSLPGSRRGDEPPFDAALLDPARPLVYMSLGSQIYHQPALFRRVMAAVSDRPVQLLLAAAELAGSAELGPLPANVVVARYVPQLQILERAAAFVTHGGANSVMEAIACGVPLLIAPICNDQFHQAHFVTRAGVGSTLDLATATTDDVWRALATLLADGPIRARMAALAASYRGRDGAAESARLVSGLAAARSRPAPT